MRHTNKTVHIVAGVAALALLAALVGVLVAIDQEPLGVDELLRMQLAGEDLEERKITIRGDLVFEPQSDFRFNALYLIDSSTPAERREPAYGFWFGLRIDGFHCQERHLSEALICSPFDPRQAQSYRFTGRLHSQQVGKRRVMWLSDVDFEGSRQLIGGNWQPVPLGEFGISLEETR